MKRRIMSLILALAVLCTGIMLTACGNQGAAPATTPTTVAEKSASEIINGALKKTGELDSMAAVLKMDMNMVAEGMTMSIPITADIKTKDMKGEDPVTSILMTMSVLGQEIKMEMYQEGQWAYVVMDDMKYKMSAKDMGDEFNYADSANDMLKEIPEELFEGVELVKAEDGSQTVTIPFPEEKFAELYSELIKSANTDMEIGLEDLKLSNAIVKVTVADGYATVCDIAFTMEMSVEGMSTTTEVKAVVTYENPGEPVTVTPPEGYQDFEEISED